MNMDIAYRFINFALIIFLYVKFLRPRINEFFYARMVHLQKRAAQSKDEKEKAEKFLEDSRARLAKMGEDITRLTREVETACRKECAAIEDETSRKVQYLKGVAKMQAEGVKKRHAKEARDMLIEGAFERARLELQSAVSMKMQRESALKAIAGLTL